MKLLFENWRKYLNEGYKYHWHSSPPSEEIQGVINANTANVKCPMGELACQDMSAEWAKVFRDAGFDVEIHHGTYKEEGHSWIEIDGHLFDPTAGQFDDYPNIDEFEYVTHEVEDVKNETIGLDDNPNLAVDPDAFKTAKKPIPLEYRIAEADETIQTKEGPVNAIAGDAIMTGTEGENWPIPAEKFAKTYDVLKPGLAAKKNIPVWAKKMADPFQVKVSWSEDLLQGDDGDYLVEYGPGDYGVVGADIFMNTYDTSRVKK